MWKFNSEKGAATKPYSNFIIFHRWNFIVFFLFLFFFFFDTDDTIETGSLKVSG